MKDRTYVTCFTGSLRDHCTYLFTHLTKFCQQEVCFQIFLPVFSPGIRLRYKIRSDSTNSFERLEFSFAHVLPHRSKCNRLRRSATIFFVQDAPTLRKYFASSPPGSSTIICAVFPQEDTPYLRVWRNFVPGTGKAAFTLSSSSYIRSRAECNVGRKGASLSSPSRLPVVRSPRLPSIFHSNMTTWGTIFAQ